MGEAGKPWYGAFKRRKNGNWLFSCRCLSVVIPALHAGAGKASWLWLFVYFVIITVGELYLSPIGLSLVSKLAPAGILDDGRLARNQLYRKLSGRLSRLLLESHE